MEQQGQRPVAPIRVKIAVTLYKVRTFFALKRVRRLILLIALHRARALCKVKDCIGQLNLLS
jgi:hypothetical protein